MTKEIFRWLETEVPLWVNEGIVSQEGAKTLLTRYQNEETKPASGGTLNMVFSLLGFALVGLGIISILAYNWDNLGHTERTILAISCLVIAQAFSIWAKYFKQDDTALKEGSGILWFLMVGASLAIIGQTYHLGGNLYDFLMTWLWLSFAIMFLMPSSGVAFFQIFLLTAVWMLSRDTFLFGSALGWHQNHLTKWWLLLLFGIWIGYYAWKIKENKNANGTLLLSWALALSLLVVSLVEVLRYNYLGGRGSLFVLLSLIFAVFYLAGKLYLSHGNRMWKRPFETIGEVGALILLLINVSFHSVEWMGDLLRTPDHVLTPVLMWVLVGLFIGLLAVFIRTAKSFPPDGFVMLTPFVFWAYSALVKHFWAPEYYERFYDPQMFASVGVTFYYPMILINAFLVLSALWMIYCGAKEQRLGLVNQGMILIAIIVWIHFMDADFSLVIKGVAFIVTGIVFLAVNSLVKNRIKAHR